MKFRSFEAGQSMREMMENKLNIPVTLVTRNLPSDVTVRGSIIYCISKPASLVEPTRRLLSVARQVVKDLGSIAGKESLIMMETWIGSRSLDLDGMSRIQLPIGRNFGLSSSSSSSKSSSYSFITLFFTHEDY